MHLLHKDAKKMKKCRSCNSICHSAVFLPTNEDMASLSRKKKTFAIARKGQVKLAVHRGQSFVLLQLALHSGWSLLDTTKSCCSWENWSSRKLQVQWISCRKHKAEQGKQREHHAQTSLIPKIASLLHQQFVHPWMSSHHRPTHGCWNHPSQSSQPHLTCSFEFCSSAAKNFSHQRVNFDAWLLYIINVHVHITNVGSCLSAGKAIET